MNLIKQIIDSRILRPLAIGAAAFALLVGTSSAAGSDADSAKKQEVLDLIVGHHVSGIEQTELNTKDIDSIIASLNDPYTEYFTEDEWKKFMDMLENNYTGIGIRVGMDDAGFFVNEVFANTPAKQAGMQDGDYIVSVDGESVKGLTTDELVSRITGIEGTEVQIDVERDGKKLNLKMKRKAIHLPALTSGMFDPKVGYIRLSSFSSDADELFDQEVDRLWEQGIEALILDLRDNPGGLLDTAGNMAKRFIEKGNLIHTRDRTKIESPYPIKGKDVVDFPVIVLVNEYSASASEVLGGALQDYEKATLIGAKTYGKGSVQSLFELSDGSVLKLTVQEYLTPKKHPVNNVGLMPDIQVLGDAPQLITALQRSGNVDVVVELDQRGMSLNRIGVTDYFRTVKEKGMIYVPSRVLAAIVDGDIIWHADQKAIEIHIDGRDYEEFLVQSEGVKLENGVSYIALNRFETQFKQFAWEENKGKLTLYENGRN